MPDDASSYTALHRDLADIKTTLARMEERIVSAAQDVARAEAAHAAVAARVDDLRSRLDKAEGSLATFRWLSGLGGGTGAAALLYSILGASSPAVEPAPVAHSIDGPVESVRP